RDHDERVCVLVECNVEQSPSSVGVAADDGHNIDAALLQPCDCLLGGVRRVSVSGRRIGQDRHPANLAGGHGISLPGLRIPAGSSVALTARNTCTPKSPTSSRIQGRWSAPTAWWWVIVAPVDTIASHAAVLAARHCSIGLPRCPATTVKYSEAPVEYTCEMWHSTSAGVPDSA